MENNSYKIVILKNTLLIWFSLSLISSIAILSLLNIALSPILFGSIAFFSGWLVFLVLKRLIFSFTNYAVVSEAGLEIRNQNQKHFYSWTEITKVGLQLLMTKFAGINEGVPHLGISLSEQNKLPSLNSAKSLGLFKLKTDLEGFLGEPKMDLYINLRQLDDKDEPIMKILTNQKSYSKKLKPLVKTNSQDEYNKIIAENFIVDTEQKLR